MTGATPAQTRAMSYSLALLIGAVFVGAMFPASRLFPAHPFDIAFTGDTAQTVVVQRYFATEAWHWPLLLTRRLRAPNGVNIALTDSIPLASLMLKLLHDVLPTGFTVTKLWSALALLLQPCAAVFALRGAGERRVISAACVAILSLSMPTLLLRESLHPSLGSHFLLLAALGLYFRLTANRHRWAPAIPALLILALLIHPYFFVMSAITLAAAPITQFARGDASWRRLAILVLASIAAALCAALTLGYGGAEAPSDFGLYSMNLLAPVTPTRSFLFHAPTMDATGGQILEGYQYLGAGVLLLVVAAIGTAWRTRLPRHAGLLIVCVALFAFALSNRVYAGHSLLLDLGNVPDFIRQFHGSGRFFWPVAYSIVIASIAALGRTVHPRIFVPILLASTTIQFIDATQLRRADAGRARTEDKWVIPRAALEPVFAQASALTIWPTISCGALITPEAPLMQLLLIASRTDLPVNTMYMSHAEPGRDCDARALLSAPFAPGELRVLLPHANAAMRLIPDFTASCREAGDLVLCAPGSPALRPFAAPTVKIVPTGKALDVDDPALADSLAAGWAAPAGPGGRWSLGGTADIIAATQTPITRITIRAGTLAPVAGGTQRVQLLAHGREIAAWTMPELQMVTLSAALPGPPSTMLDLTFRIAHPVRPSDRGINADSRPLGLLLQSLRLD